MVFGMIVTLISLGLSNFESVEGQKDVGHNIQYPDNPILHSSIQSDRIYTIEKVIADSTSPNATLWGQAIPCDPGDLALSGGFNFVDLNNERTIPFPAQLITSKHVSSNGSYAQRNGWDTSQQGWGFNFYIVEKLNLNQLISISVNCFDNPEVRYHLRN
jgi:hypothetical protein